MTKKRNKQTAEWEWAVSEFKGAAFNTLQFVDIKA